MPDKSLYIGLISGTSIDAIDAGLFEFGLDRATLVAQHSANFPAGIKKQILDLTQPGPSEIDTQGSLDVALGEIFAEAALTLIDRAGVNAASIAAIGSHGQTIRHRPKALNSDIPHPFTLQIGDPNTIAHRTGICTVADFRRRDMAAGGQGAPLAPAFHRAVFFDPTERRSIVNVGGMSNLSALGGTPDSTVGYDTGPGNVLMDAWIQRHRHQAYDHSGRWASGGTINNTLLHELLAHPFFHQAYPKSTGREDFHIGWIDARLKGLSFDPQDVQATLCALTATTIAKAIAQHQSDAVYLCGGGAHNSHLHKLLAEQLPNQTIATTEELGIAPDWVEAGLCAWLARQTLQNLAGNLPRVTGAERAVPLGGIYNAG